MASHRGRWFLGLGCLVLLAGIGLIVLAVGMMAGPGVPSKGVLEIRFSGPIVEIAANDPFQQMFGGGQMSYRGLRKALKNAATDDRIVGVRVKIDRFGGGFATAQEIRALLEEVSAAGKHTAAYMDTAGEFAPGNLEYLVAAACDEVSMNPMGDVNLIGLSARSPFIRGLFDKLGIEPEFPGRGEYKTARFMYTERDFTPEQREMTAWLLDSLMDQLVQGVADSRTMDAATVRQIIDRAPLLGDEAVDAGLIDHLEDWGGFTERLKETFGKNTKTITLGRYVKGLGKGHGAKIAVITATGAIMRGESGKEFSPLFGGMEEIMGSDTIAKAWRDVRRSPGVKAVIFRIDSPGGSAVASEVIRQEMARTAEKIPVVVSMANVAGSGGYWITCGASRIVADPGTLTASIGVFAGHLNSDRFWRDKIGITFGRMDRGMNANIYGGLENWTDEQRAVIDRMLDRIYDQFVQRVASSRGMTREQVDAIGRGRVFTGEQALEKGLVDALGGFDTALAMAKELASIPEGQPVRLVDYPRPRPFWQRIVERQEEQAAMARALRQAFEEGRFEQPGVAWMPPIIVR